MSQIDEVKSRLDIVEVISAYVPLKKAGRNFKGLCPFHVEKTPSFVVFPDSQNWHCFGGCSTGGDVFSFIMKKENLDFGEALRLLAERAGVTLEERRPEQAEEVSRLDHLREILATTASYFGNQLQTSDRAQVAREYVQRRGLNQETIEQFEIGYAPDQWDALRNYLRRKGYSDEDMLETGLIIERDSGGYYDRFRHRLVIPIRDRRGRVIGFGARALDDSIPKYLNSPQTPLFDKSSVLFGLDKAIRGIRARGEVIIVEGYMDVLTAHQYGIDNVIASMGTALTEKQLAELSRSATRFVLALDSDAAGDQATLRGLHLIRQTVGRRKVPTLSARGALRHEDRLTIDLRILSLPEGVDPDELIQADKPRWERLVQDAEPLVKYYLNQIVKDLNLSDPGNKSIAVQEMKPILQELNDEIERRYYIQSLARILQIDEAVVEREVLGDRAAAGKRGASSAPPRRRSRSGAARQLVDELTPTTASARGYDIEGQCLAYLVQRPTLIHQLSFTFAEAGVPFLESGDFLHAESQSIFARITHDAELGTLLEKDQLLEALEGPLAEFLLDLLTQQANAPSTPADEISDDLVQCALRLKARSLRQSVERLYYLLQESTETGQREDVAEYARLVQQYSLALQRINRVIHERSMVGRREHLEPRV